MQWEKHDQDLHRLSMNMYEIIRFDLEKKKKKKAEIFYLQIKNDFFFLDLVRENEIFDKPRTLWSLMDS